jgi:SAM-dependent methyltransferase
MMGKYFIKDNYVENLNNLYYDDAPADGVIWQPDVYRYAIDYAKKHGIKNIVDIGSGNGDKLFDHKDEFDITFIDFGANLNIIKDRFKASVRKHSYVDQNFEESFPDLPAKIIKDSVVICSDVIEHIRDMNNLCEALVAYSKAARLLIVSTPERYRLYGFDQSGIPTNPCHVREWRLHELEAYFANAGMNFQIGLTRTNDKTNQRATLCVISGKDFAYKKDADVAER